MDRLLLHPVYFILAVGCLFAAGHALLNRPDTDPELDLKPITRYRRPETTTQRIATRHEHDFSLPLPKHDPHHNHHPRQHDHIDFSEENEDDYESMDYNYHESPGNFGFVSGDYSRFYADSDSTTSSSSILSDPTTESFPEKNQVVKMRSSSCKIFLSWWNALFAILIIALFVSF